MRKEIKRLLNLLGIVILVLLSSQTITAESYVHYINGAEEFTVNSKDLFNDFERLIPGGIYHQNIELANKSEGDVDLSFQMLKIKSEHKDTLSEMDLSLHLDGKLIYESNAGNLNDYFDRKFLVNLKSNEQVLLKATLEIDPSMSNEHQGTLSQIEWEFYAEEFPSDQFLNHIDTTSPGRSDLPTAGMEYTEYFGYFMLILFGLIILNYTNKIKK